MNKRIEQGKQYRWVNPKTGEEKPVEVRLVYNNISGVEYAYVQYPNGPQDQCWPVRTALLN